jgi:transketolase
MMGLPVTFVYTHDSVAVGEDGPTHQPIEHLANLRSIPNLHVIRPADGRETAAAWILALQRSSGPSALILSRQNLPQLPHTGEGALQGAYIVGREAGDKPELIVIASGSELQLAMDAKARLEEEGRSVRVVSMVCKEKFLEQNEKYRQSVIPPGAGKRILIEAALPMGWEKIIGPQGVVIGIEEFGASAPGEVVMAKKGITVEAIIEAAGSLPADR